MRLTLVCLIAGWVLACGGGDDAPDAITRSCTVNGGADCWDMPTDTLKKLDTDTAANLACSPAVVAFSDAPINVTGTVTNFQDGLVLDNATVEAFQLSDVSFTTQLGNATSSVDGAYGPITLAAGAGSRLNWRTTHSGAVPTYALNEPLDIAATDIVLDRESVSNVTADIIPALIGTERKPGFGAVAGGVIDCDGDDLRNAIATLSSTSGAGNTLPTFVAGAEIYYFSMGTTPVGRGVLTATDASGSAIALNVAPGEAFFQIWGFIDQADIANGETGLTLISEFKTPVIADSVFSIDMEPTENL